MLRITRLLFIAVALTGFASAASGAIVWDESVDGDLSDDPLAPTGIMFAVGVNGVIGTDGDADTRDYITFTIEEGYQLDAILLQGYVDVATGGDGDRGYIAINDGDSSAIPDGGNSDSFLGGSHLDPLASGTDLLAILAAAPLAGTGFEAPLGPGTYSFLIQQTGTEITSYDLEFMVSAAVPLPAAGWLLLSAIGLAGGWSRRAR